MTEYAIINWEKKVVDIISVNDPYTLDYYVLPEGECIAFPTFKTDKKIEIGMTFDPLTEIFI